MNFDDVSREAQRESDADVVGFDSLRTTDIADIVNGAIATEKAATNAFEFIVG